MVSQWRRQWLSGTQGMGSSPSFPVGVVQIGPDTGTDADSWAIRQGQTADYGYMPNPKQPNTFLAAAYDLPNPDGTKCFSGCVHIFNKREVGRRLAAAGFRYFYNATDVIGRGPFVTAAKADAQQPNHVVLTFDTGGGTGLIVQAPYLGFEVYLTQAAQWVTGNVTSYTKTEVTVAPANTSNDQVTAVRYAYADKPCPNLKCAIYGATGLPPTPFLVNVTSS